MPVFQSLPDLGLSRKYHLKAVGCDQSAEDATDLATEQQWHELATQWRAMADRAAKMAGQAVLEEFD
ncbi:MAG: hypothetical protein WB420_24140 [Bradyrhizobium sp.]|jgi:hypothetical protein